MFPSQTNLKARLYDLTEERDALLCVNEAQKQEIEELEESAENNNPIIEQLKRLAETRADTIHLLAKENRELKAENKRLERLQDDSKLKAVAGDVADAFRYAGVDLF